MLNRTQCRTLLRLSGLAVFTAIALSPNLVRSQSDSTAPAIPPPKAILTGTAYIEPYFAYDFNKPISKDIPYLYNYSRHNEFNLNLGLFSGTYDDSEVRGTIGLQVGTYPMANYAAEPALFQHIYQASAGVQIAPNFWLDAGIFPSHYGIETAIGKDQWTLTRSLVAENSPYFETGIHPTYSTSNWNFGLFVLNGWQNIRDQNSNKALGTQVQYSAGILTLNSSTFFGNEKPDSTPRNRIFHDFYAIVAVSKTVSLSGVFDIGWEQTAPDGPYARWYGTSIIARFLLSNKFAAAIGGEYYSDPEQVLVTTRTRNGYDVTGYSLNFDYIVSPIATIRLEGKRYAAKDAIFVRSGVPVDNSTILTSSMAVAF